MLRQISCVTCAILLLLVTNIASQFEDISIASLSSGPSGIYNRGDFPVALYNKRQWQHQLLQPASFPMLFDRPFGYNPFLIPPLYGPSIYALPTADEQMRPVRQPFIPGRPLPPVPTRTPQFPVRFIPPVYKGTPHPLLPTRKPFIPVPTRRPSVPTRSPSIPTRQPPLPTRRPSIPTRSPSIPTRSPSIPTRHSPLPTRRPSVPTRRPSVPTRRPTIPTRRPPIPLRCPNRQLCPIQTSMRPVPRPRPQNRPISGQCAVC